MMKHSVEKHTILFLAANPDGTDSRALDREACSIESELRRSGYRERFDFVAWWAAEPLDLLRKLREFKPTIVHFAGHGAGDGLYFQGADGQPQPVSREAIAEAFLATGASAKLVVLNACLTESVAEALLATVDCVVGMSGSIHPDAARSFAIGFYGGLGEHESIAAAFAQGKAAINLEGLRGAELPQLKVRADVDANQPIISVRRSKPCPYPGMRPYTADDAEYFHGRDDEIDELIGRLRAEEREIYVIGPSGSGKSSLVTAGVLPRLARGVTGLGPTLVRTMRPGERPAMRLSDALDWPMGRPFLARDCIAALLAYRSHDSSVLLIVDQLEELFTLASTQERDAFLSAVHELRTERRFVVIVTLRADFFGRLMDSTLWPERCRNKLSRIEVGPLRGRQLREAIMNPASTAGVMVEPALVERLLADAASAPGILPLLQETMVHLWDQRADGTLTLAHYQALGEGDRSGLAVAVARRADATLRRFSVEQTELARRILIRLISFGEGCSDTRRQQSRAQLCASGDDAADFNFVLQTMVGDRLLTVDEDGAGEPRVDLAHEVMISAWPTLVDWIRTHRADEHRRRHLEAAARQWVEHGRGERGLLDPIELAEAVAWQQTESARRLGRNADLNALIAKSRRTQTRQRRSRRLLLGGAFVLLAGVAIGVFELSGLRDRVYRSSVQSAIATEITSDRELQSQLGTRTSSELHCMWFQLFERGRVLTLDHARFGDPSSVAESSFFLQQDSSFFLSQPLHDNERWYRADRQQWNRDRDEHAKWLRAMDQDMERIARETGLAARRMKLPEDPVALFWGTPGGLLDGRIATLYAKYGLNNFLGNAVNPTCLTEVVVDVYERGFVIGGAPSEICDQTHHVYVLLAQDSLRQGRWFNRTSSPLLGTLKTAHCR